VGRRHYASAHFKVFVDSVKWSLYYCYRCRPQRVASAGSGTGLASVVQWARWRHSTDCATP